jgi:predicted DNA-binding transcriptional regulator AlpA
MHANHEVIKQLLTVKDIENEYGIGRTTIYKHLKPGPNAIPAFKLGSSTYAWRADFENWLRNQPKYQ